MVVNRLIMYQKVLKQPRFGFALYLEKELPSALSSRPFMPIQYVFHRLVPVSTCRSGCSTWRFPPVLAPAGILLAYKTRFNGCLACFRLFEYIFVRWAQYRNEGSQNHYPLLCNGGPWLHFVSTSTMFSLVLIHHYSPPPLSASESRRLGNATNRL